MASPVKGGGVLSLSDAITDSPCSPPHMKPARVQTTLRPRVMSRRRSMARLLATGLKAEVATPKFVLDADEHASRKRPRDALSPGDAPTAPAPARRRRSRRAASLSTQAREAMINAALIASMEQAAKRAPKDMLPTTPEPVQVGKPVKPTTKAAKPSKKQRRASSGKKQRRAQRASSKKCSTRGKKVPSQRPEVPAEASKSPAVAKPPTPQPGASCGAGTDSPPAPAVPAVERCLLHLAEQALHTSSVPDTLEGRSDKVEQIQSFLRSALDAGRGGSLYLCGGPGTGKTSCVAHCIKMLLQEGVHNIKPVYINAMAYSSSPKRAVLSVLVEALCKRAYTPSTPFHQLVDALQRRLAPGRRSQAATVLLVLDEVDALASGHSEVLQHLFHWAAAQHTKLLLVTISNSFDLISRALPLLQTACPQQVAFETYTVPQIAAIIQRRIASCCGNDDDRAKRVVDPGAVEFLARKVAKTSGDLRKSLSLCSRAVAVAAASNVCSCGLSRDTPMAGGSGDASAGAGASTYNGHNEVSLLQRVCESATSGAGGCRLLLDASVPSKPCSGAWKGAAVGFGEMAKVVREGTTSHVEAAIRGLPQHCQIVLYVALQQLQQSKSRLSASPLQHAYARFCKERRLPMAPSSQFSDLLSWLASSGLINVTIARGRKEREIRVDCTSDDFEFALCDSSLLSRLCQNSSRPPAAGVLNTPAAQSTPVESHRDDGEDSDSDSDSDTGDDSDSGDSDSE